MSSPPGTRPPRDTGRTYNSVTRNLIYGSWAGSHHPDRQPPPVEEHPWTVDRVPADPAAHLIYADWLDEQGEGPRADLVRVRCRLRELPPFEGIMMEGVPRLESRAPDPWEKRVTVTGGVRAEDLLQAPPPPRNFVGQLRTDAAVHLRFYGQEALKAVLDGGSLESAGDGLLLATFVLYPFVGGDRVYSYHYYYRPYDDPHEAERLTLRRRERELRALFD